MEEQILFAGFGGQGVLSMSKFVAESCMSAGKNVSWVPSYGPEMRGGTCNCTVTVADDEIASPITGSPQVAIVLNRPSLEKFESKVAPGGTLVVNTSLVDQLPTRTDVTILPLPVNELAEELKNPRGANMILLGICMQYCQWVDPEYAMDCFEHIFAGKKESVIEQNRQAFAFGVQYAREHWKK